MTVKSLSVGGVAYRNNVLLAPMSGVSDVPFRRAAWRAGAGMVISEMVASEALVTGHAEMRMKSEAAGLPVHVVQLAGREARWMDLAARMAEDQGADVIDINMGCPARKVTNGLSGSALMRDLDHAMELVRAVIGAVSVPVTLKMRLGWDDGTINAPELARRAADAGIALVTVHGRTRQQFYKGQADWAAIRAVRATIGVPLVANGDCDGVDCARRMIAASGADGVMVGRAAVGRPWLVGQVGAALSGRTWREPSDREKAESALDHYACLLSTFGKAQGVRHARKHLAAYADCAAASGAGLPRPLRTRLVTTTDADEAAALLARCWTERAEEAA